MENKKKVLISSALCCLPPLIMGLLLWNVLPDNLIRHLGPMNLQYSPKKTVVFLFPLLFLLLHIIIIFRPKWIHQQKRGDKKYWFMLMISNLFFMTSYLVSYFTSLR